MDMVSLSRNEVCRIFGLTTATLNALIADGHLLCHVSNGESRIPLAQLESFFREGLIRVFRTQALEETTVHSFETPNAMQAAVTPQPAHVPDIVPPPLLTPVQHEEAPVAIPAPSLAPPAEERRAIPLPPLDLRSEELEDELEGEAIDLRVSPRYIPRRQINGIIDDVKFTIVQLSRTGLRIKHTDEIVPTGDSKLTFALLNPARSFMMKGRVVWTSAATTDSGERKFYISGVKITEHVERLVSAIDILNAAHDLQPDRRASSSRGLPDDDALPMAGATDDEIALVIKAVQHFSADPLDANRWYARGRFALADAQVRRDAPRKPREREEVLGIWEYLERQLDMTKINDILMWVRRNRGTAARV